jgi:hypothetical protein
MKSLLIKLSAAIFLILVNAPVWCQDLLTLVATNLRSARSSPAIVSVKCPTNLGALTGISVNFVVSKLGRSDLNETGKDEHGQTLSIQRYIFANSSAKWFDFGVSAGGWSLAMPLGDPFTVMYFVYNKDGQLIRASCDENRGTSA